MLALISWIINLALIAGGVYLLVLNAVSVRKQVAGLLPGKLNTNRENRKPKDI